MAPRSTDAEGSAELESITAAFPELSWHRARRITAGWDHVVVMLDDAYVFRFPQRLPYTEKLALEAAVLAHLAPRLPVAVPRYDRAAADFSFAGYPLVPGSPLTPGVLHSLRPAAAEAVLNRLAGFLTALHTAAAETPLDRLPAADPVQDRKEVRRAADLHLPAVLRHGELADVGRILDAVDALPGIAAAPAVPLHNDLYSQHLLLDGDSGRLGVIDFSDMCLGDPAADFARLHEYGTDVVAAVYSRYDGPRDPQLLDRARIYWRWFSVYMLTDYFEDGRSSWPEARSTFDRIRAGG